MVHAPELLGYEQYTPFPAACQWQSERPPPVAGAFAGLFMALGSAACADKSGRTGRLPRALAREPAPFVAANSTYSLRLRQSPSEGRPTLAGRSTSLPWGPQAPFWRKGTPKTGKRRPPHFLVCLSPFGLAPTVIYRAHPSLWTSEGRPALAGRSSSLPWGPQAPILAKGHAKNRQTSPASCFSLRAYRFRCGKFYLHPPLTSVALGGKNSLVGKSMRRKSSQGLSLEATHSFSGTQKS